MTITSRCAVLMMLAVASLFVCCESGPRARLVLAGPRYANDCDSYLSCDPSLSFVSEKGIEVEVTAAYLSMVVGIAEVPIDEPDWGSKTIVDVTADFSVDGGVVSLPGDQGYCTVRITTRPKDEIPLDSSVDMWFWMDSVRVGVKAALNIDVGLFQCDLKRDENSWITLETVPLHWFDDVTSEMIAELESGVALEPGSPVADAILVRIGEPEGYRTVVPASE